MSPLISLVLILYTAACSAVQASSTPRSSASSASASSSSSPALALALAPSPAPAPVNKRKVFMEYLGADGIPISFKQAPVHPDVDFVFILGFAIDADEDGRPLNGRFRSSWSTDLTPQAAHAAKAKHPNAKLFMSLGGWSVYTSAGEDKQLYWYDPQSSKQWLANAYASISQLAKDYSLDGIDIDYESFKRSNTSFPACIGELVSALKSTGVIRFATIAPFDGVEEQYLQQFYTTHNAPSVPKFVSKYLSKAATYGVNKTMVSMQVVERGIQGEPFFQAVEQIANATQNRFPGIMIYSLDASIQYHTKFVYEIRSQMMLAKMSSG